MASAHYFYFPLTVKELEERVAAHQESFDEFLNDTFSEQELSDYEGQLDSIAAVYVQPIISELSFDDFYASEAHAIQQKFFFESCKSSISLENLPDFHSNPFQVTYLIQLLALFDEVLIDKGGVEELVFKQVYLDDLETYKNVDSFISSPLERPVEAKTTRPVHPIDFLIQDVYQEVDRLRASKDIYAAMDREGELSEKARKIFKVIVKEKLDSTDLLKRSGLNPKDFDDNLERLKFWLRKV